MSESNLESRIHRNLCNHEAKHGFRLNFKQFGFFKKSQVVSDKCLATEPNYIAKTRLCNIQLFLTAVKMVIFGRNILMFLIFLLKTKIVGTR